MAEDRASFTLDLTAPGAAEELERAVRALGLFNDKTKQSEKGAEALREQLGRFGQSLQGSSQWIREAADEQQRLARMLTAFSTAANAAELKQYQTALRYVDQHLGEVAREAQTAEQALEALQRHASRRGEIDIASNLGGLRQWVDELPRLEQKLEATPRRWRLNWTAAASAVQVAVGNVMAEMGQAALRATADFIRSSLEIRIMREGLEHTFREMLGGQRQMEAAMARLNQAATEPGVTFDILAQKVKALMQEGLNLEAAVLTVTEFGNAVANGTGKVEDTNETLNQFLQMMRTGRVTAEDFNVLAERSSNFGAALQLAFGTKSLEQIREMDLTINEFAERFVAALQKTQRAPNLTANAIVNLRNEWDQAKAEFGKGLIGDEAKGEVDELADALKDLRPLFGAVARSAGDAFHYIIKDISAVYRWVKDLLELSAMVKENTGLGLFMYSFTQGNLLPDLARLREIRDRLNSPNPLERAMAAAQGVAAAAPAPNFGGASGDAGDQPSAKELKAEAERQARERQQREIEALREERAKLELARKRAQAEGRSTSGGLGNPFGTRPLPTAINNSPHTQDVKGGHATIKGGGEALDLFAPGGTPIYAAEGGVVEQVAHHSRKNWGHYVRMRGGRLIYYGHLNPQVKQGQQVEAGQQIGTLASGLQNPHLHYEIYDREGRSLLGGPGGRPSDVRQRLVGLMGSGSPGTAGTPNLDAQIAALDKRIADLQGGEAVTEYQIQALDELLRKREADRATYIDKLQAMLDYAEITGDLPAGADQMGLQTVSDVQAALAEAQALQVQEFGTAADWYRLMVDRARDAVEAERDLIDAREEALAAEQSWAEAQLRSAQESRRSLAEQLAFLDQINALTLEQIDLQQQADELDPDRRDTAGLRADSARMQQEVAFKQQRHDLIERDRDLREQDLQQAASLAQARLNLAEMTGGESAAAAQYEEALRRQLQFYGQMGDQIEYVRVKLELLRLEKDRHKATIGEQILMAGPGAGSITAYLKRIGVNPVDLGGPTIDATALRPGTLRGDVPLDGLAGDAASRAIASRGTGFVDRVATAAGLATEQILDEVIAGFRRAG